MKSNNELDTRHTHEVFDTIWRLGYMTRNEAYEWISAKLKVDRHKCHIGGLTSIQKKQIRIFSHEYLDNKNLKLTKYEFKQRRWRYNKTERKSNGN